MLPLRSTYSHHLRKQPWKLLCCSRRLAIQPVIIGRQKAFLQGILVLVSNLSPYVIILSESLKITKRGFFLSVAISIHSVGPLYVLV